MQIKRCKFTQNSTVEQMSRINNPARVFIKNFIVSFLADAKIRLVIGKGYRILAE
jgi:hypothetical protein